MDHQRLTQVGRALRELGIQMIPAYSPRVVGKKRYFALAAVREVLEERAQGHQGRRKHGFRPWFVKWVEGQLRRPSPPRHGKKPFWAV